MAAKRNPDARTIDAAPAAIRDFLDEGDCPEAVYEAFPALLAQLAWVRKHRSTADSMLLHAEVAGAITGLAARLRDQEPRKPPGYTGGIPRGRDLRNLFDITLGRFVKRGSSGSGA
jgi:hypothetical protein